jgi:REP element-mobilizing transposase RayT
MIDAACERVIHHTLRTKAAELSLILHAAGNTEDHVHAVVSIPPKLAVADCLRHLKGASSRAVNHMLGCRSAFKWQEGYGAMSIGERSLSTVIAYATNQKEHHRAGSVIAVYERATDEDDRASIEPA